MTSLTIARIAVMFIFLSSCNSKNKPGVKIYIDLKSYGWYFLQLNYDSSDIPADTTLIHFDPGVHLEDIEINGYDIASFDVYDQRGSKISSMMKCPSVLNHYSHANFFVFYNPSEEDLKRVNVWLPTDSNYQQIAMQTLPALEKLLGDSNLDTSMEKFQEGQIAYFEDINNAGPEE